MQTLAPILPQHHPALKPTHPHGLPRAAVFMCIPSHSRSHSATATIQIILSIIGAAMGGGKVAVLLKKAYETIEKIGACPSVLTSPIMLPVYPMRE